MHDWVFVWTQGAEESCLTVMLAQFIAQIDLVIQNNERDWTELHAIVLRVWWNSIRKTKGRQSSPFGRRLRKAKLSEARHEVPRRKKRQGKKQVLRDSCNVGRNIPVTETEEDFLHAVRKWNQPLLIQIQNNSWWVGSSYNDGKYSSGKTQFNAREWTDK